MAKKNIPVSLRSERRTSVPRALFKGPSAQRARRKTTLGLIDANGYEMRDKNGRQIVPTRD